MNSPTDAPKHPAGGPEDTVQAAMEAAKAAGDAAKAAADAAKAAAEAIQPSSASAGRISATAGPPPAAAGLPSATAKQIPSRGAPPSSSPKTSPQKSSTAQTSPTSKPAASTASRIESKVKSLTPKQKKLIQVAFMILVLIIAVVALSHVLKPGELAKTLKEAKPGWLLLAVGLGLLTDVGAAIPLMVFAPVKVSFKDAFLTQVASAFAGIVAPAGLGGLAVSVRYLMKRGVTTASALATMALMDITQFLPSFVLVVFALIFSAASPHVHMDFAKLGWVALAIVVVVALILLIPKLRRWAFAQLTKVWNQFYPQVKVALAHPKKLWAGIGGALIVTLSYIAAVAASVAAFGKVPSIIALGAAYLLANTLGSMIPSPGGVGSVEAALAIFLAATGVGAAAAVSAAVAFRLTTFYIQIPIGYVALQYMENKGLL